jgi:single-stranded DNA-binding protein
VSIEAALFGTLGRDAEPKISKNGKPYLRLNVACGEGDTTQWVGAMVFDERAIAVADGFVKGARVYLEGKLSLNEWTAQDGTTRSGLSVMSWHCRLSQIGRAKAKLEKPKPAPQSVPGAAFDAFHNALAGDTTEMRHGRRAVTLELWKAECFAIGILDRDKPPNQARALWSKYRLELIAANRIACDNTMAWAI